MYNQQNAIACLKCEVKFIFKKNKVVLICIENLN
jgi:hypothetical protein